MQRRRFDRQSDCGEKRDPDKRSLIIQKKENELDPDTQLEKQTFAAKCTDVRIGKPPRLNGHSKPVHDLANCTRWGQGGCAAAILQLAVEIAFLLC